MTHWKREIELKWLRKWLWGWNNEFNRKLSVKLQFFFHFFIDQNFYGNINNLKSAFKLFAPLIVLDFRMLYMFSVLSINVFNNFATFYKHVINWLFDNITGNDSNCFFCTSLWKNNQIFSLYYRDMITQNVFWFWRAVHSKWKFWVLKYFRPNFMLQNIF